LTLPCVREQARRLSDCRDPHSIFQARAGVAAGGLLCCPRAFLSSSLSFFRAHSPDTCVGPSRIIFKSPWALFRVLAPCARFLALDDDPGHAVSAVALMPQRIRSPLLTVVSLEPPPLLRVPQRQSLRGVDFKILGRGSPNPPFLYDLLRSECSPGDTAPPPAANDFPGRPPPFRRTATRARRRCASPSRPPFFNSVHTRTPPGHVERALLIPNRALGGGVPPPSTSTFSSPCVGRKLIPALRIKANPSRPVPRFSRFGLHPHGLPPLR